MRSWGGLPERDQAEIVVNWRDQIPAAWADRETLAVGCGRSYGDSALAASGTVLNLSGLNRVLEFDLDRGIIRCEAGVTLGQIMHLIVDHGWMLPVLPGTQFVTVGGAIANDIHGKNHHRAGTFGSHVERFALLRSNGEEFVCSSVEQADWFNATIGGLGLTGVILWVELSLRKVDGPWLDSETLKFSTLDEFFELSAASETAFEYTVSWIDCLSDRTRGHFTRANHSAESGPGPTVRGLPSVPIELPFSPVNRYTLKAFNSLYYARQRTPVVRETALWNSWFFPLDSIGCWNRLYGRAGFRQYQCVVPKEMVAELLEIVRRNKEGSFLAVLKVLGSKPSPGLLSFPRPGVTLALDFPWRGAPTLELFKQLDAIVFSHGGAIYPAKDAQMSAADFCTAYPAWEQMEQLRDPRINSLFWQRVTEVE